MDFTPLHRSLGIDPQPLTDELLNQAVAQGVLETHDLDWKSQLPAIKNIPQSDFPKDIAAMANSGGGAIVYGVTESQKAATGREDVGDFHELWERALRNAAITAISPPVFGLRIHKLGTIEEGNRSVVVVVPRSLEGPHLIYRNELFGAPVRNDADTVWMKERQIEAMYRARFDERRHALEALDSLFTDASAGRDTEYRAWLIAVAHPRVPRVASHIDKSAAPPLFSEAMLLALTYANENVFHPLQNVEWASPRPGLRRWVAVNSATSDNRRWKESHASLHHDGSVTIAAAIGAHKRSSGELEEGHDIHGQAVEGALADFMALIRTVAGSTGESEYHVRVGIEWRGDKPLKMFTTTTMGVQTETGLQLHRFTPVEASVDAGAPEAEFRSSLRDLALDCVNQGGVSYLHAIYELPG